MSSWESQSSWMVQFQMPYATCLATFLGIWRPMHYAAGDMTYLYNGLDGEIRKWTGQRLSKLSILNLRAYRFFPGSCRLPECLANLSLMAAVDSCDLSFLQRVCCVHGELEHYH